MLNVLFVQLFVDSTIKYFCFVQLNIFRVKSRAIQFESLSQVFINHTNDCSLSISNLVSKHGRIEAKKLFTFQFRQRFVKFIYCYQADITKVTL